MHTYVASGQDDVRHAAQEASGITFYPGTELMTDGMLLKLLVPFCDTLAYSHPSWQRTSEARWKRDLGSSTK